METHTKIQREWTKMSLPLKTEGILEIKMMIMVCSHSSVVCNIKFSRCVYLINLSHC